MTLRTFVFRAKKNKQRSVVRFMRRRALPLLRRIPACRAAFFTRNPKRQGEYLWVTVWTSDAAVRAAQQRRDWKQVVREEEGEYFTGRPQARHYAVLLKK